MNRELSHLHAATRDGTIWRLFDWGSRGRGFKSRRPDQHHPLYAAWPSAIEELERACRSALEPQTVPFDDRERPIEVDFCAVRLGEREQLLRVVELRRLVQGSEQLLQSRRRDDLQDSGG